MMTAQIHQCPRCEGAINRENYVRVVAEDRIKTMFCCEFCNIGWDIEEYWDGEVFSLELHAKLMPEHFERFMCRLVEARVA